MKVKVKLTAALQSPAGEFKDEAELDNVPDGTPAQAIVLNVSKGISANGGLIRFDKKDGSEAAFIPMHRVVDIKFEIIVSSIIEGNEAAVKQAAASASAAAAVASAAKEGKPVKIQLG